MNRKTWNWNHHSLWNGLPSGSFLGYTMWGLETNCLVWLPALPPISYVTLATRCSPCACFGVNVKVHSMRLLWSLNELTQVKRPEQVLAHSNFQTRERSHHYYHYYYIQESILRGNSIVWRIKSQTNWDLNLSSVTHSDSEQGTWALRAWVLCCTGGPGVWWILITHVYWAHVTSQVPCWWLYCVY